MSNRSQKIMQYYLWSGVVEGVLALIILLLIPSDPKNAWLFGFSKFRLAMVVGILLVTGAFAWWARGVGKKDGAFADQVARFAGDFPVYGPVMLTLYGAALFGTYLYLYFGFQPLSTLQGVLVRIFPVIFYAFTRWGQAIIVWVKLAQNHPVATRTQPLIQITPAKVAILLAGIALFLILTSSMLDVIEALTWEQKFWGFRVKFDLDQEANVPTYFSTLNLFLAAGLFTLIGLLKPKTKGSFSTHWLGLGLIFFFLSIDETSVLHEKFILIFKTLFHPQGIFFFGWVILAIPFVALTALAYLRFFLHLPNKYKIMIFVSILIYLSGAVGMEMVGGWYAEHYGEARDFYNVLTTLEETLEPIGMISLIYTLLLYVSENFPELKIKVGKVA
ncbi:MAG TPA: hypothetical protein PK530_11965 [Anaerolineales bacterium]|nr:hypothetical protein [Anaerolineales bacterium]